MGNTRQPLVRPQQPSSPNKSQVPLKPTQDQIPPRPGLSAKGADSWSKHKAEQGSL